MKLPRLFIAGLCLLAPVSVFAETWNQTSAAVTYEWATGANWNPTTVPNGATGVGNLSADIDGDLTINLSQLITLNSLTFNDTGATTDNNWILEANGGSLAMQGGTITNTSGANQINSNLALNANTGVDVAASTSLTINGSISGTGTLTKTNSGTLFLNGSSAARNANMTFNGGGVTVNAANGLGSNLATIAFNSGTLTANTANAFGAVTINQNGGTISGAVESGFGTAIINVINGTTNVSANHAGSTINLGGTNAVVNISAANTSALTINNGTANATAAGALGGTNILNGGTLNINNAGALTGSLTINGGTLGNSSAGLVTLSSVTGITFGGNFNYTGANGLNLGTGAVTLTKSLAVLANHALTIGGNISGAGFTFGKTGVGTVTLNGTNSFDTLLIRNGTVMANSINAVGTNVTMDSRSNIGASLFFSGVLNDLLGRITAGSRGVFGLSTTGSYTISEDIDFSNDGGMSLGVMSGATATVTGNLTTGGGAYRFGGGGGTLIINSPLTGATTGLVVGQNGAATVALNNNNSYGGGTLVTSLTGGTAGTLYTEIVDGTATDPSRPWGAAGTTITLKNGALSLGKSSLTSGQTIYVGRDTDDGTGYDLKLDGGGGSIRLSAGTSGGNTSTVQIALNNVSWAPDVNGSGSHASLIFYPTNTNTATDPTNTLWGTREIATIESGLPAVVNGILPAYIVNGTTANFLTWDSVTKKLSDAVATYTHNNVSSVQLAASTASETVSVRSGGSGVSITFTDSDAGVSGSQQSFYAARFAHFATSGSMAVGTNGAGDILRIGAGGLLTQYGSGGNLNFYAGVDYGSNEGIWTVFGTAQMQGLLRGTAGFVKYGPGTLNMISGVTGGNLSLLTGGITVAGGRLTLGNDNTFPAANLLTVLHGGTLDITGRDASMYGVRGEGMVTNSSTSARTITLTEGTAVTHTFSGFLSGNLNIAKTGAGTQEFTGVGNNYTGSTSVTGGVLAVSKLANGGVESSVGMSSSSSGNLVVNGGTLRYIGGGDSTDRLFQIGGSSAGGQGTLESSGTGAINFTNTGAVAWGTTAQTRTFNLGGTNEGLNTLSVAINNNGGSAVSVVKNGTGTWVLAGTNGYTGATTVNGGKLLLTGTMANSATSVESGGTFGGTGTTLGSVTVKNGAVIAAGMSIGTLNTGALNINDGGTFALELNTTLGTADQVNATGSLTLGLTTGSILTLTDLGGNVGFDGTYDIIKYTTTWNNGLFTFNGNQMADGGSFIFGTNQYTIDYNYDFADGITTTNSVRLTSVAVPEPAGVLLMLSGLGVAFLIRRRR
jgi:fibronectin-binding autotransporter adhesin